MDSTLDLVKVFGSSPLIYSALLLLSVAGVGIWLYSLLTFRPKDIVPVQFVNEVQGMLRSGQFQQVSELCTQRSDLLASLLIAGLRARHQGASVMLDSMKSEGKRLSAPLWQRLSLLNDIALVAPMLGLLGTVIGMFYAFYDMNRSIESINSLFDGLGVAVGTTVFGLIVAIMAMIFATTLKYRLVNTLSLVENEALRLSALISQK